jgi:hypothetical protein
MFPTESQNHYYIGDFVVYDILKIKFIFKYKRGILIKYTILG